MKILKEGNLADPTEWTEELDCHSCDAMLEIEFSDLETGTKIEGGNIRDRHHVYYKYVICPECGTEIEVEAPRFRPLMRALLGRNHPPG